jgi:uncharacterized delta-60 repeat protein
MSLKKFSVNTLSSKKLSTYKFSSNRLSLRRFPFPSAPVTSAIYVEDVYSTFIYNGIGIKQSIPNGIRLGDGATSEGWIATLSSQNLGFSVYGEDVAIDSSGNVYVCGTQYGTGHNFQIAKYNSTGTLLWQKTMSTVYYASSITVDSNDNVYVAGTVIIGTDEAYVIKLDSSGNIQWQRVLGGTQSQQAVSIKVDSSGNIYIVGYASNASSGYDLFIAKYDASGTLQWQRLLGLFGAAFHFGYDLALDSSGNPHICGIETVSGNYRMLVAKYDTSGVFQWQRRLTGSGTNDRGNGVAVSSSGDVYVCGYTIPSGLVTANSVIAKYSSSGTLQWQRTLGIGDPKQDYFNSVTVDSNGDVFVGGQTNAFDSDTALIAKYNSSGVLQWQRILGRAGNDISGGAAYSIKVDNRGSMYICGQVQDPLGKYRMLIAKLPADGTGTSSYSIGGYNYRYEQSTLENVASTFSNTAAVLNNTAATFSNTSNTFTTSTSNLTSSLATVPTGTGFGGMVWMKSRSGATDHAIYDTVRGATKDLGTNLTTGETTQSTGLTSFDNNGFTLESLAKINTSGPIYSSWTFRKQPKFFDIVTYTGNGVAGRTITHNLGSVPGCIIVKRTNTTGSWSVYHRSIGATRYLTLNTTAQALVNSNLWNDTEPTNTVFTVGTDGSVNDTGGSTYVAYLFAHDAGGFGDLGTDSIISCGTYLATGVVGATVNVGFEPQWLLVKKINGTSKNWYMFDNIRGVSVTGDDQYLIPNDTNAESAAALLSFNATGFTLETTDDAVNGSPRDYIYIAIRRGPMRTPTDASKVFQPVVYTGTNVDNRLIPTSILTDMIMARQRNSTTVGFVVGDRLRGNQYLLTDTTTAGVTDADSLMTPTVGYGNSFSAMNGFGVGNDATSQLNISTLDYNQVGEAFARAPGFFDIVTYTGTGVARTINHNLGAVPKMMWIKKTNSAGSWVVYSPASGSDAFVEMETSDGPVTSATAFNSTAPTSSVFSVGVNSETNANADNFVAYLFGEIPGISKVSYYLGKGAGTVNQVDCGFTTGARFLLIKSLFGTASWYVWDTARGIVAGNDPYIRADLPNAEVTSDDYVDSYAAGFELSTTAPDQLNGSYADNWESQLTVAGTLDILDIMYENGYWVFGDSGNNIRYSTSGYSWTTTSGVLTGVSTAINGVAYGNGLYLAVGDGGRISTSSNLTTWTTRTSGTASVLTSAAYAFGKYWACGTSGTVVSSTDGVTWSTVSIGTAQTLNVVKLLNGILVFAGNNGALVSSADGINFTVQNTGGASDDYYTIAYGNNLYVAMGNSGVTRTSPDLITWTSRSPGALSGNNIRGVVWTDNRFVAVATAGETGYSSDGITWSTGGSAGTTPPLLCVAYGNEMCILGNGDGDIYVSNPKFIYIAIA